MRSAELRLTRLLFLCTFCILTMRALRVILRKRTLSSEEFAYSKHKWNGLYARLINSPNRSMLQRPKTLSFMHQKYSHGGLTHGKI